MQTSTRPTFKEVNSVSFPGPNVHTRINSVHGDPAPANLQCNRISKACSVFPVLIEPVPAISKEIGVKADDHLPIGRPLLPDPIKHRVESTFTAPWVQTQAHYRK